LDIVYQFIGIGTVFGLTYIFFTLLGQRGESLLVTREEGSQWNKLVSGKFGGTLTVANIFATVTSLATVYLFFIGSSKLFGLWTLVCCFSIVLGATVTNYFTSRIRKLDRTKAILASPTQSGAVVASLFWQNTEQAKLICSLVRYLSLFAIGSIVWLEFALFGDITSKVLGQTTAHATTIVGTATFAVVWFTLRYGLRGFVMADLLHSGIVVGGVIAFLFGTIYLSKAQGIPDLKTVVAPMVPPSVLILFVLHVLVANAFLTLVSESHWLRLWVFSDNEVRQQLPAQMGTAIIWAALIIVGLLASSMTGAVDTDNVAKLLAKLKELSPFFVMAFWLGGTAALFSTSDAQIYAFRLVLAFDTRAGRIPDSHIPAKHPLLIALAVAILSAGIYLAVRTGDVPFDKIVFVLLPITLNLLPAFAQLAYNQSVQLWPLLLSLAVYVTLSIVGFAMPATLAAALTPVLVAGLALALGRKQ
jgi:hypothetical protein